MVAVLVVALIAVEVAVLACLWSRHARQDSRTMGGHLDEPARLIDDDTRNALTTGVNSGHAWMASDRAARARAVTERARRSPWN